VIDLRLDFFEKLKILFPKSQDAYDDATQDDIEGDEILWVIIYMFIGRKIGEDFSKIPDGKLKPLFELIEEGVSIENENLGVAICTGLLESMTDPLMKDREVWKQAQEILGEVSLQHILGMNKFYGIE
jgi:hypothetical protein